LQPNDTSSTDDFEADDLADQTGGGGNKLKEFLASVGAVLTAVLAVGGGIYVLSRDAGTLHGANAPPAISAAVAPPIAPQAAPAIAPAGPTASPVEAPRANAATIYRCEVNGKTVYANAPCSGRNIRRVDVFVNKGFEPTDTSTLLARPPSTGEPVALASSNERARAERCKWIEGAIRQNEETARLPQPGWRQDQLIAEKRQLLDEKHELRC
jgi:hypothetical protein